MIVRQRLIGHLSGGAAGIRLLAVVGIAAAFLAAGCGKVTSTPIAPASIDTGVVTLTIQPAASSVSPGGELPVVVQAVDRDGGPAKDGTVVNLTNDALGAVIPSSAPTLDGRASVTFRAGTTEGTSTLTAEAGGTVQTAKIKIAADAPPPTTTPPPGNDSEPINLSAVTWVNGADISEYPRTATLGPVTIRAPHNVCSESIKYPSNWPPMDNKPGLANANHIVLAKINGKWYGGCWEALFPNTAQCRPMETMRDGTTNLGPFGQVEQDPFWQWRPVKGEQIGFMVTTWVRGGAPRGITGRSNVVMTTWPW